MNPKKKPNYNPKEVLEELTDAAVEIYAEEKSLHKTADELDLNPIKIRKLLITAGVYESDIADSVDRLRGEGKTVSEIMPTLHLSKASVNSYLPYTKIPYCLVSIKTLQMVNFAI